jgi:hypothetical protein
LEGEAPRNQPFLHFSVNVHESDANLPALLVSSPPDNLAHCRHLQTLREFLLGRWQVNRQVQTAVCGQGWGWLFAPHPYSDTDPACADIHACRFYLPLPFRVGEGNGVQDLKAEKLTALKGDDDLRQFQRYRRLRLLSAGKHRALKLINSDGRCDETQNAAARGWE